MYVRSDEFEKMVQAIRKAIKAQGLYNKDLWTYGELKAVAAEAHADVVDVMYVARYCR